MNRGASVCRAQAVSQKTRKKSISKGAGKSTAASRSTPKNRARGSAKTVRGSAKSSSAKTSPAKSAAVKSSTGKLSTAKSSTAKPSAAKSSKNKRSEMLKKTAKAAEKAVASKPAESKATAPKAAVKAPAAKAPTATKPAEKTPKAAPKPVQQLPEDEWEAELEVEAERFLNESARRVIKEVLLDRDSS